MFLPLLDDYFIAGSHAPGRDHAAGSAILSRQRILKGKDSVTTFCAQKRVVVTGGAGFLGQHVVGELQKHGCGKIVAPRRVDCDFREPVQIRRLFSEVRPHAVVHLAARISSHHAAGRADEAASFHENALMGIHVLEQARIHGVEKIVLLGSANGYPERASIPLHEDDFWNGYPETSRATQAMAKKMALVEAQAYRRQFGIPCIYLIVANLYGPGDHFGSDSSCVIPSLFRRFAEAAVRGERDVILPGNPAYSRDFLYVEDCAAGIVRALERYNDVHPVNLGTGIETPVGDLAPQIAALIHYTGTIRWDSARATGPERRALDTRRAEHTIDFRARTPLRTGLQRTAVWLRDTNTLAWPAPVRSVPLEMPRGRAVRAGAGRGFARVAS